MASIFNPYSRANRVVRARSSGVQTGVPMCADTWLARFHLGLAYLQAGSFAEAYSEFDICLKRRGEAAAVFWNDLPTMRRLPPLYYYLGRAQEGLKSPGAKDSYNAFLLIKEKSDADPLVEDARKRLRAL